VTAPALANTRVYRHHHLDSTRWDHVAYRDDDIVITTPYKCGTTWTQQITCALLHGPGVPITRELTPWIDSRFGGPIEDIVAVAEAQTERRFFKSHLPLDGTRWDERVRFVVVGRDTRDVFMSLVNHYSAYGDVALERLNTPDTPGEAMPKFNGDVHELWRNWISRGSFPWETDGWPFWSFHHHLSTWWTARNEPNVLFVHYADMKADPVSEVTRLTTFLGIDKTPAEIDDVVAATEFSAMKAMALKHEAEEGGPDGAFLEGGIDRFIFQGTNGRWRDVLTAEELVQYEDKMATLEPSLRAWLENGRAGVNPG
jgi:aryl sulfotransferase